MGSSTGNNCRSGAHIRSNACRADAPFRPTADGPLLYVKARLTHYWIAWACGTPIHQQFYRTCNCQLSLPGVLLRKSSISAFGVENIGGLVIMDFSGTVTSCAE